MPTINARPGLVGRRSECDRLSGVVAAAKAGRSQVLVIRGEPGIGKTALLDFVVERAVGCRVARASGVESEMELAYAGLHQLCRPHLDRLGRLTAPQQAALGAAFGLRAGDAPDGFVVGLAVLGLLSEVAEDGPLICVLDDAQWLDHASSQVLHFVARRLTGQPVAVVVATRDCGDRRFAGLPELPLQGLGTRDATALLETAVPGTLDRRVRDRIVAECHGNPLALLELPRVMSLAELAFGGGDGLSRGSVVHRLEQGFLRQVEALPAASKRLLLTAAVEPTGDVPLLWRAGELLGLGSDAAVAAEAAGLIELQHGLRFRHPLVRTVICRAATRAELRTVHRALADAIDPEVDPDRRAWHKAQASTTPDETVAAELERSAGRALAQGGLASAAAFLERAAVLTPDPARRVLRFLEAAQAKVAAGAIDDSSVLLASAQTGRLGETDRARVELLQARMRFATHRGNKTLPLLLAAAQRLEPLDPALARDAYLDALTCALWAGRLAAGPDAREVARFLRQALPASAPRARDVLLEGLAVLFTDGYAAAAPISRRAVQAFMGAHVDLEEALSSGWLAASTSMSLWDDASWDLLTRRQLEMAQKAGAVSALPLALAARFYVPLVAGELAAAASIVQRLRAVEEVAADPTALTGYAEVSLAALRGDAEEAEPLLHQHLERFTARGEGAGVTVVQWARAVLCNGCCRYAEALVSAREGATDTLGHGPAQWSLAEVVESGVRSGDIRAAKDALEALSATAAASGTDWALGVAASRRALLSEGRAAEDLHREALERLGRTLVRVDLARAHLLFGEWLRREGRRVDARAQLRIAHAELSDMGLGAFAERARRELLATGETVRRRTVGGPSGLTSQESHIAGLAAQGLTNPEIGAALYISARTVEWHLRKVFAKLGVATRRELRQSLREESWTAWPD
jgi:DNA-binding CsgD family transcriptional regulator